MGLLYLLSFTYVRMYCMLGFFKIDVFNRSILFGDHWEVTETCLFSLKAKTFDKGPPPTISRPQIHS